MYSWDFPGRRTETNSEGKKVQVADESKPRNHGVSATIFSIQEQNTNEPIRDAVFPLPRNEWVEEKKSVATKSIHVESTDPATVEMVDETSFDFNADPEDDPIEEEQNDHAAHVTSSADTEILEDGPEEGDTVVEEQEEEVVVEPPPLKRRNQKKTTERIIEHRDPYLSQAADVDE